MRIFLAGIMQGSHLGPLLHAQDYRQRLRDLLEGHLAGAQVYDPLAQHAQSIAYDDETGRRVFLGHNRFCRQIDMLVAFVPEASMGTAIEMWEAWQHGALVVTISPLVLNWTVRFLSHAVYPHLDAFSAAVESGELARLFAQFEPRVDRRPGMD